MPEAIDPQLFRDVLSHFPTGVVAVTALDGPGNPTGMTVGSFLAVSLDPPLVGFCVAHTSTTWPRIRRAGRFCVSVLASEQTDLCRRFAGRMTDRFAGLRWASAPSGAPVVPGALAWIDCELDAVHAVGDHDLVVGAVRGLAAGQDRPPLLFFRRTFGAFAAAPGNRESE